MTAASPSARSSRDSLFVAVAIASFVLLGAVMVAAATFVELGRRSSSVVEQTIKIADMLAELGSQIRDAETAQRGYLLTGDANYLRPYNESITKIPGLITQLAQSTVDSPGQIARIGRLRPVIAEKLAELASTIEMRRDGRTEAALRTVQSDRGIVLMDQIRGLLGEMRQEQDQLLNDRQRSAEEQFVWLRASVGVACLGIVLLAMLATIGMRRGFAELRRARDAALSEMSTRLAAEEQLRQSQKMEAIGQLTGGIAHDFNNMLAVILGGLDLAKRRLGPDTGQIGRFLEAANEAAQRAAKLTAQLLAFSRQQPLVRQVVSPNKLVGNMSEMLRRTLPENIELQTVLAAGLWSANVDPQQLESAILNLCVNARDAMPQGGRLTIETSNAFIDESYAALYEIPVGQYVLIAVTDTGQGMSKETIARAFEPFFTTKPVGKGTGLGLSQVFGFVKQSGGHVKIYSEPGAGTTLKIYLPRHHAEGTEKLPAAAAPPVRGKAEEIILVVEDDDRMRAITVALLRELGYTVIHASRPELALTALEANPSVLLLFTDVVMPEMSGRALAQEARRRRPALRVLFTTGYTRNAIVHNGEVDADALLLSKPFTIDQLAARIRAAIDQRP